jgi:hypothetical protein
VATITSELEADVLRGGYTVEEICLNFNFHISILVTVEPVGIAVMLQTLFGRCQVRISVRIPDILTEVFVVFLGPFT